MPGRDAQEGAAPGAEVDFLADVDRHLGLGRSQGLPAEFLPALGADEAARLAAGEAGPHAFGHAPARAGRGLEARALGADVALADDGPAADRAALLRFGLGHEVRILSSAAAVGQDAHGPRGPRRFVVDNL